jgi:hypothetical protein
MNKLIEAAVLICTQHEKALMIWDLCTNKLIEAAVLIRTQDENAKWKTKERCQSKQRCQRKSNEPRESSKVQIRKL